MKVLFAGPSLHGQSYERTGLDLRAPARQGDLHRAVRDGATVIGLVDGVFGFVPSVWHKEILHALSEGVRVLGAASLGALRAAECASFGMEPIGAIAHAYLDGRRREDADVCLAHCPEELGFQPLSEPLVDVEATVAALLARQAIAPPEAAQILAAANAMYFADRSIDALLATAGLPHLAPAYRAGRVSAKAADALLLVKRLHALPDARIAPPGWGFQQSDPWRYYLRQTASEERHG